MAITYLTVEFAQKDAVKALGARWDPQVRKWYVPEGKDVSAFSAWLPSAQSPALSPTPKPASKFALPPALSPVLTPTLPNQQAVSLPQSSASLRKSQTALVQVKAMSLSELLGEVVQAVSRLYKQGQWTIVEVVGVRKKNHVYLELTERDEKGDVLARADAMIWSNVAQSILPRFEQATSMTLSAGMKLLVRARPVMNSQYGFRLYIEDIDPQFSLGELEAAKRKIRAKLQQAGIWGANKALAAPWDYFSVLVIAPEDGAGLGDFRAEAQRFEQAGVCHFEYVYSKFQGIGAAAQILQQAQAALKLMQKNQKKDNRALPDALVIIRGGGSANDLAWLDDYTLAEFICKLPIPVLTGIGHERDSTILDEVAHTRFDTPSKVIAGIQECIVNRARQAQGAMQLILSQTKICIAARHRTLEQTQLTIQACCNDAINQARISTNQSIADVRIYSMREIASAQQNTEEQLRTIEVHSRVQVARARQNLPALLQSIRDSSRFNLRDGAKVSSLALNRVLELGSRQIAYAQSTSEMALGQIIQGVRRSIGTAREGSLALIREITGQGPQKTLSRGFAHVRDLQGHTLKSAASAQAAASIKVTFHDGEIAARVQNQENP